MTTDRLLTAREVADHLGLTVETVLVWARRGDLPAFRLNRAIRFRAADLDAWLSNRAVGSAPGPAPTATIGTTAVVYSKEPH